MHFKALGLTGLRVSEVGFGTWQLGGEGWGPVDARDVSTAVEHAIAEGINLFDTAPIYGFGRSEELLSRALGSKKDEVVIVSKAGLVWDERKRVSHDASPEALSRELEKTLKRLRRDRLDVLLLHWPDPRVPLDESVGALDSFRASGRIRAWGVSNCPAEAVLSLRHDPSERSVTAAADSAGPVLEYPMNALRTYAAEYVEAAAAGEKLLPEAARRPWGFLAFDVLVRGILGGRYGPEARFGKRDIRWRDRRFQGQEFERNLERARRLSALAGELGAPPSALAIRTVLDRPGVTSCLVGMRTADQALECAAGSAIRIPEEFRGPLKSCEA